MSEIDFYEQAKILLESENITEKLQEPEFLNRCFASFDSTMSSYTSDQMEQERYRIKEQIIEEVIDQYGHVGASYHWHELVRGLDEVLQSLPREKNGLHAHLQIVRALICDLGNSFWVLTEAELNYKMINLLEMKNYPLEAQKILKSSLLRDQIRPYRPELLQQSAWTQTDLFRVATPLEQKNIRRVDYFSDQLKKSRQRVRNYWLIASDQEELFDNIEAVDALLARIDPWLSDRREYQSYRELCHYAPTFFQNLVDQYQKRYPTGRPKEKLLAKKDKKISL